MAYISVHVKPAIPHGIFYLNDVYTYLVAPTFDLQHGCQRWRYTGGVWTGPENL